MAEYTTPGVYIENNPNKTVKDESTSASTGGFIGITQRGVLNKPVFITSWNAFINAFAYGMDSPFLRNSDLAYAVYGFFQNGGKRCYILRTAHASAKSATLTGIGLTAKEEGSWGNNIKVEITTNDSLFDILVYYKDKKVESFLGVSSNDVADILETSSSYISATGSAVSLKAQTATSMSGGVDGIEDIDDGDFTNALSKFDSVTDMGLLCIPGQTSVGVETALIEYCKKREDIFAILDAPEASDVDSVVTHKKNMTSEYGALYFPWIKVSDPLSSVGKTKDCPPSGHMMGVYARTFAERGVWKVPAGTDAVVRGAVDIVRKNNVDLTNEDVGTLNTAGIVAIIPKTNYGIVAWGAKVLSGSTTMKYISDVLLDIYIKRNVNRDTQQFVFEPNNSATWLRLATTVESFLDTLWRSGALHGDSASEAYYVKCDGELNTASVRSSGKIICEVGYASNKPAEFVVFRISHEVNS